MLLITAALAEELQVVLELCPPNGRLAIQGVRGWKAAHGSLPIVALKTGMGPARAANSLKLFLSTERPARILVLGYGGALDPSLQVGDLVIGERASLLLEDKGSGSTRFLYGGDLAACRQPRDPRQFHAPGPARGARGDPDIWVHHRRGRAEVTAARQVSCVDRRHGDSGAGAGSRTVRHPYGLRESRKRQGARRFSGSVLLRTFVESRSARHENPGRGKLGPAARPVEREYNSRAPQPSPVPRDLSGNDE